MLTDYRQYDIVKNAILNFRAEKENHKGQYKKFVDEKWTDALLQTYSDDIDAGKTKTRETTDKSLKKFLTTKKKTHGTMQTHVSVTCVIRGLYPFHTRTALFLSIPIN